MALTKNSFFMAFALLLTKVAIILYGATCIFWISSEYYYRSFIKNSEKNNKSTEVSIDADYHYYEQELIHDSIQHYEQHPDVRFPRNARTTHIDCGRLLHEDKQSSHVKELASSRVELGDQNRSMSCVDIQARVLPPKPLQTLQFGVAHARIVYESYELIEEELRSSYHPQNVFCYAIDYKAKEDFTQKIEKLSKCLPNVLVPTTRYSIGRTGINGTRAHFECLKALMEYTGWEYVMLMQNYDIMIKSVYETVSILQKLGGANDVHVRPCESYRYNQSLEWDVQALKFFRNEKDMKPTQRNASLTFARGAAHATLSRAAVNWMVNTVDLTKTFEQLDLDVLGVDEVLIPTLQVSDSLDMPGRFTAECVQKGNVIGFITRVETWSYDDSVECRSQHYRHSVCVYGIEDFAWLSKHPKLMANKMMPSFDYGAVDCMHELLFNRTHLGQVDQVWNLSIYETQPYVQYHKYRKNPYPGFQLNCNYGI